MNFFFNVKVQLYNLGVLSIQDVTQAHHLSDHISLKSTIPVALFIIF